LWSAPLSYSGRGRPRTHGKQFKLNDTQSWWEPEQTLESLEPKLGRIRVRKWDNLHFRGSPKHPMTLILVERLEAITGQLKTQSLWLVWVGLQMPHLTEIPKTSVLIFYCRICSWANFAGVTLFDNCRKFF